MAFEGLTQKLQNALGKMTGKGKLSEQDVKEGMREIRMALLEADVNYAVAKDFIKRVTEKCVGQEVLSSLTPSQQVMKIVSEELTATMGTNLAKLTWSSSVPTIYMLCGLQGAGKTTMAAKLAGYLQKQGKKVMLAACDIYRPAAIKQLQVVGEQVGAMVYEKGLSDSCARVEIYTGLLMSLLGYYPWYGRHIQHIKLMRYAVAADSRKRRIAKDYIISGLRSRIALISCQDIRLQHFINMRHPVKHFHCRLFNSAGISVNKLKRLFDQSISAIEFMSSFAFLVFGKHRISILERKHGR